jgi:hypothetical protein
MGEWRYGFMPQSLYPQPENSLDRRLSGSQSWSEHSGEEKKSLSLLRIESTTL